MKEAMEEIESLLGIKINKVIASVPANNAEFTFIKGEVKIINENNVVSAANGSLFILCFLAKIVQKMDIIQFVRIVAAKNSCGQSFFYIGRRKDV